VGPPTSLTAQRRRGGAQGGGRPRPSDFCAVAGRERVSGPTRRAKWVKKCFGQLRPTRSRQDESIEVGEVGPKRPSLGCNGVHVTWWGPLIARSSHLDEVSGSRALTG
jgi:hypothetical protein